MIKTLLCKSHYSGVLYAFGAVALWVVSMVVLRYFYFKGNATRDIELPCEQLSKAREYHNNTIYRLFEFYVKVILALFGGVAYLMIQKNPPAAIAGPLLNLAGWLTVLVTFLFSVLVWGHQKSKVEKWTRRYSWYEPLFWNECWLIASAVALAVWTRLVLVPQLVSLVPKPLA